MVDRYTIKMARAVSHEKIMKKLEEMKEITDLLKELAKKEIRRLRRALCQRYHRSHGARANPDF